MYGKVICGCGECGTAITASQRNIVKRLQVTSGLLLVYRCHACGAFGKYLMASSQMREMAMAKAQEQADEVQRRQIGRVVKGFAVDLEAVDTVEDIELLWDYQERIEPESIRREGGA